MGNQYYYLEYKKKKFNYIFIYFVKYISIYIKAEEIVRKYNMYGYVECRLSDDNNIRAPLDMIARACVEKEDVFKSKGNISCCVCL